MQSRRLTALHALAAVALLSTSCTQFSIPFEGHDFANATLVIVGSNSAPADGISPITFTLTLMDGDNQPVSGWSVAMSAAAIGGVDPNVTLAAVTSNSNGVVTGTVTSTAVGTSTLSVVISKNGTVSSLPSATAQIVFTQPPQTAGFTLAGLPFSVTSCQVEQVSLTAVNAQGSVVTDYVGTVHFSSSDSNAVLPADATFALADAGVLRVPVMFSTVGTQTFTVVDTHNGSLVATQGNIQVSVGAPAHFALQANSTTFHAGTSFGLNVEVVDSCYNVVPTYTGTAHFTATDPCATVPADYHFTLPNAGVATFNNLVFVQAGNVTLAVSDAINHLSDTLMFTGIAGAQTGYIVTVPTPLEAGTVTTITVVAVDAFNNVVVNAQGTVHLTSSDGLATLPMDYHFPASNNGQATLALSTVFKRAGWQTIVAQQVGDSSVVGISNAVQVTPAGAASLFIGGLANPVQAGSVNPITVTALDIYGNTATSYDGTVSFTPVTNAQITPMTHTFTTGSGGDSGVWSAVTAAFGTAGQNTVAVQDTTATGIHGNTNATVIPGPIADLSLSPLPSQAAVGQHTLLTVTAVDANNNAVPTYVGTVTFSSTDTKATVSPAPYTFVTADQGSKQFQVTFGTSAAAQTVTVHDAANAAFVATSTPVLVTVGGVANLSVVGFPSNPNAGQQGNFVVQALDGNGNLLTNYGGSVTFSSSDLGATFGLTSYTFSPGTDAGTHTFSATLFRAGSQSITATDTSTSATGSQTSIVVNPLQPVLLNIGGLSSAMAGAAQTFAVTAIDQYGNTSSGYTGTITFTSSDTKAVFTPASYSFAAGDSNGHVFSNGVVFKTAGAQTLNANDVGTPSIAGHASVNVTLGPTTRFGLQILDQNSNGTLVVGTQIGTSGNPLTAGTPLTPVVTVYDQYGNVNVNYTGTVHFSSTDTNAALPANYQFDLADAGVHTFTKDMNLVTAGTAANPTTNVAIDDTLFGGATANQNGIYVVGAGLTQLYVGGIPSPIGAGTNTTVTVRATDPYGNIDAAYTGTITFSSSAMNNTVPANYTFTVGDAGAHTFTGGVTLRHAGTQSVTAADVSNGSLMGAQSHITVSPATAQSLTLAGLGNVLAGTATSATVTALDPYSNVATGYSGTVSFSSTDHAATLPSAYPFTVTDAGVHTFANGFVLVTAGVQNVTVSDSANALTANQNGIVVAAGAAQTLTLTGLPSTTVAGSLLNVQVQAFDPYNNVATSYAGTVTFTSSDTTATLPPPYAFQPATDAGTHSFTAQVQLKIATNSNVTVRDVSNAALTATDGPVSVSPGSTTKLTLSNIPSQINAGQATPFTVTATDTFNNPTPTYGGVVTFTSSDPNAIFAATATFSSANYLGTVTYEVPGNQSFTVTGPGNMTSTINSSVAGVGVLSVASNANHACALIGFAASASLKCWGANPNGALGYGDTSTRGANANTMGAALPAVPFGSLVPTKVSVGGDATCALLYDNTMRCWGDNSNGNLGYGNYNNLGADPSHAGANIPALTFTSNTAQDFAVGNHFTCAITQDQKVRCWGLNTSGQLGYGDSTPRNTSDQPALNLNSALSVTHVALGNAHACALLSNGTVKCWGSNSSGQLGYGDTTNRGNTPATMSGLPAVNLGTGRTATAITAGYDHSCALLDDSNMTCWGGNANGQLGLNSSTTPEKAPAGEAVLGGPITSVSAGYQYTCVTMQNGNVNCFGANGSGQLGFGDTAVRGSGTTQTCPIFCSAPWSVSPNYSVGTGRKAQTISASNNVTCVLMDNQEVKCWGYGANGQLGQSNTATVQSPNLITPLW